MQLNKIYNENCLDTMAKMPNNFIDLVITSPPYNIIRPNQSDRGYDVYSDGMSNNEYIKWTLDIFSDFNMVLKPNGCVLYNMSYGGENTTLMSLVIAEIIKNSDFTLADIIVWKKQTATPNAMSHNKLTRIVEYIYVFCRKDEFHTFNANKNICSKRESGQPNYENIYNFIIAENNDGSTDINKATFSTKLVRRLLLIYAKENSLIYDPFIGTGTTANGCIIENHNYIGSEISKKQCDYANNRLKLYLQQTKMF